jgi:hypothetical protein
VFNIHSPQLQTCLREPGKAFLITIVFAKVKKTKTKTKNHKNQKKKKIIPWPLLQVPKSEAYSPPEDLQSLAVVPSIAVWPM